METDLKFVALKTVVVNMDYNFYFLRDLKKKICLKAKSRINVGITQGRFPLARCNRILRNLFIINTGFPLRKGKKLF